MFYLVMLSVAQATGVENMETNIYGAARTDRQMDTSRFKVSLERASL